MRECDDLPIWESCAGGGPSPPSPPLVAAPAQSAKMFMGVAVLHGTRSSSTSTGSSMSSLDRVLIKACRVWMHRFRAPLAHVGLIDYELLKHCTRQASLWSGRPKRFFDDCPGSPHCPDPVSILRDEDDETKARNTTNIGSEGCVWSDDDVRDDEETVFLPTVHSANGIAPLESVKRKEDTTKNASDEVTRRKMYNERRFRGTQHFRRRYLYAFPTDHPPPSVVNEMILRHPDNDSTADNAVPDTAADAESFLVTAAMERNHRLEEVVQKYRILAWPMSGRPSQCGRYKVKGDADLAAHVRAIEDEQRLDFYLGPKR